MSAKIPVVTGHQPEMELLRALARVRLRLASAATERDRPGAKTSSSVAVFELADSSLSIDAFLTVTDEDGVEAEWFAGARSTPDGSGWTVQRTAALQTLVDGEVNALWGSDLPDVVCPDTASLAAQLPALVEELLTLSPSGAVE